VMYCHLKPPDIVPVILCFSCEAYELTYNVFTTDTFKLVETVTGKPVYRFPTGNRFSERMAGYQIYHTSCRQDPGNVDADASRCRECRHPPFSHDSSVVGNF